MTIKQVNNLTPELLTARQAELIPHTSAQTVLRWAREGTIPAVRLPSGRVFFDRADILKMLEPVRAGEEEPDPQQELPLGELGR